jgi:hypothetical protein
MLHEFALHQQLISGAVSQPIDALNCDSGQTLIAVDRLAALRLTE